MTASPAKPKKLPKNHRQWLDLLRIFKLPVDEEVRQQTLHKIHSPTANSANVSTLIEADPALAIQVYCEASKALSLSGTELTSLEHAISLLGFPRVETIVHRAPILDESFSHHQQYRQEITVSVHAATQAQDWAERVAHWSAPQVYWSALFHRAPIWAMWATAGKQMSTLEEHRALTGCDSSEEEQQLLGTTLEAIGAAIAHAWHLPETSQQAWKTSGAGNPKDWVTLARIDHIHSLAELENRPDLARLFHNRAFVIALANHFAKEAEWDWYSQRTLRDMRILATALAQPLERTIALCHSNAAKASRSMPAFNSFNPSANLLDFYEKAALLAPQRQLKRQRQRHNAPAPEVTTPRYDSKATTEAIRESTPGSVDGKRLAQAIAALNHHPEQFQSLQEAINYAVDSIREACGCQRALCCLTNRPRSEIHVLCSSGVESSSPLGHFHHKLSQHDLFARLLAKQASLFIRPANRGKMMPLLPATFQLASGVDQLFMMSLFVKQQPLGILYADNGSSDLPLNDDQYAAFKQIAASCAKCLNALAEDNT